MTDGTDDDDSSGMQRVTLRMEPKMVEALDELVDQGKYANRSQAIRKRIGMTLGGVEVSLWALETLCYDQFGCWNLQGLYTNELKARSNEDDDHAQEKADGRTRIREVEVE